jgi:hypothetical protein
VKSEQSGRIQCPKCKRKIAQATEFVSSYIDPNYHCKCGFTGKVVWARETAKRPPKAESKG